MKILILILLLAFAGEIEGKSRRKRNHRVRAVPFEVIKDYGNGRFNVEQHLPDLMAFLQEEQICPRVGQGRVHNLFGYEHLNAMDVGVSPKSSKGKRLISYLRAKFIPFLAISGRKKGVSTGPHIHIGFPSPKTYAKHPVGTVDGKFNARRCPFYRQGAICL